MFKKILPLALMASILFVGCDTDEDIPDAPMMPDVSALTMNTDAFDGPREGFDASGDHEMNQFVVYNNAYGAIASFESQTGAVYVTMNEIFSAASGGDRSFSDNTFTWTYSASLSAFAAYEDTDSAFDFVLEADVSNPTETSWSLALSGRFQGNDVEDVPLLNGVTANDGQSGSLNVNFGSEQLNALFEILFNWQVEDGVMNNLDFNAKLISPQINADVQTEYTVSGDNAVFNLGVYNENAAGYVPIVIQWNFDTTAGSITSPNPETGEMTTNCWDANKVVTACP